MEVSKDDGSTVLIGKFIGGVDLSSYRIELTRGFSAFMKISVITIFPEIFAEFFRSSIIGKAVQSGNFVLGCVEFKGFHYHRQQENGSNSGSRG